MAANKGSTSIRFNYNDTSFMFLNCHLASGQKEYAARFNNLEECYTETITNFHNTEQGERPRPCHHQVLMGDMNWRVEMPYQEAVALASENRITDLKVGDQLLKRGPGNALTKRFKEGNIAFKPTFKYDPDSDVYDTSKKQRVPSWTDRILYK